MDWKRMADQARDVINKRGGPESLKEDADELRDIAEGPGTLADKAKKAAEALREPGAHRGPGTGGGFESEADAEFESEAGSEPAADESPQESEPQE